MEKKNKKIIDFEKEIAAINILITSIMTHYNIIEGVDFKISNGKSFVHIDYDKVSSYLEKNQYLSAK